MRIMHVGGPDIGLRVPMMCRLAEYGFDVAGVGSARCPSFSTTGITYYNYPLQLRFTPRGDVIAKKALVDLFREHRPDVVHAFHTKPAILATLAAAQARVPVRIRSITGLGRAFASNSIRAKAIRPFYCIAQTYASRRASCTLFQNRDDQQFFLTHGLVEADHQMLVPGSGTDIEAIDFSEPSDIGKSHLRDELNLHEGPIVLMAARMVRYKGVLQYLKAARLVRKRMPNVQFLLAGAESEDPKQAIPQSTFDEFADCVRVLGYRRDLPAVLSLATVVTLPTYYREGVPRILLEAAAMRKPLVATDMPGCRDAVIPGENGLLIPPKDEQALAEALLEILAKSPVERAEMGTKGRRRVVENFSMDQIAHTYATLYRKLLAHSPNAEPKRLLEKKTPAVGELDHRMCGSRWHGPHDRALDLTMVNGPTVPEPANRGS